MCERPPLQHCMLDVMPELDHQSDGPPFTRRSGESSPECPKTDQHHDRIAVVHDLGTHEPWIKQSQKTASLRPRPTQYINLISLGQVLGPMRQHYEHEQIER